MNCERPNKQGADGWSSLGVQNLEGFHVSQFSELK
jgi:hypothetical protein